jgi:serine/threonine protein kinase
MAPEIIRRQKYGVKVDVWAIGMFVIELGHRTTPFHGIIIVIVIKLTNFVVVVVVVALGMPPKAVLDRLDAFGSPTLPTTGNTQENKVYKHVSHDFFFIGKGKKWSNDMKHFVAECLVMDVETRPSAAKIRFVTLLFCRDDDF